MKPEKMKADFDFLVKELQQKHQGLYEYLGRDETNRQLDSIRRSLDEPQSKLDFYKTLRYTIGLTNEGHSAIDLARWDLIKLGLSKSFLPTGVKFLGDTLVVTQSFAKRNEQLKKGDRLIAINGHSIDEIKQQLFPLIPTDGFNQTSNYAWSSGVSLSLLYRLAYGKEKHFELEVEEFGTAKRKTVDLPAIRYTDFKGKNASFPAYHFNYEDFALSQINDSTAYLCIPGFGDDDLDYDDFYRKQFSRIDSMNIRHLIIDVQYNGGGTEGNENLLFSYLLHSPIKKYKRVTMLPDPYEKNKHKEDYRLDKWELKDSLAERGAYTLYSDYYSDLEYQAPDSALIYDGKLYVLISGKTFSGGAEFASLVKMTNRGLFIGEETGGAYEGNVSGYAEYIELPHSKIEVKIPTVHFQVDVDPTQKGRGVLPDFEVQPRWGDYMNGQNTLEKFAIDLITHGSSSIKRVN